MRKVLFTLFVASNLAVSLTAQSAKPLYENNFEKAAAGTVPEEFLVYEGAFAVREEGGNKFLELPGAPLETFAVLFGPTERDGLAVSARIFGTAKGRRMPTFAVGLNNLGGYRLQVSASKKAIELFRGDDVKATAPYEWQSGKWTRLVLQVRKLKEGEWRAEGKVWTDGGPEPADWTITFTDKPTEKPQEPVPGRATIWGSPYSGTPIRFDDLAVLPARPKP